MVIRDGERGGSAKCQDVRIVLLVVDRTVMTIWTSSCNLGEEGPDGPVGQVRGEDAASEGP